MKKNVAIIFVLSAVSILGYMFFHYLKFKFSTVPSEYVGRQSCVKCHEAEQRLWQGSHHDMAMQQANEATVLGNFNDVEFDHFGQKSKFFKKEDAFYVRTDGTDGGMQDFKISYTFGFTPLQQYLVEFPGGRLQCLSIAWDDSLKQWYHLNPDKKITSDDWMHWTRGAQNWNQMCAECHSTGFQKNYDPGQNKYRSAWSEIDVSCEACHGPASGHLKWAGTGKLGRRFFTSDFNRRFGLRFLSRGTDNITEVDGCAPCHSRRERISGTSELNGHFMDVFKPSLLEEGLYYPDGQIREEVYVYGSFLQSKMYHNGVRCSDCHDPHSLKLKAEGNALCIRCHKETKFDTGQHHYHADGSPGAFCVDCHMGGEVYMGIDFRRDHSFRIPRPDLSVKLGVPNACNKCHSDKTLSWAADKADSLWGAEWPRHYGQVFADARNARAQTFSRLLTIIGDSSFPAIVRATAISLLGRYPGEKSDQVRQAFLKDNSPLIRHTALEGLGHIPPRQKKTAVSYLLKDSVRAIRIEAANILADVPPGYFTAAEKDTLQTALQAYRHYLDINVDFPGGRMNAGNFQFRQGNIDQAITAFQQAIRIDNRFIQARFNLADLYNRRGRNSEAEAEYKEIIRLEPRFGEAYYSLGLLLAKTGNLENAAEYLEHASTKMPDNPRVHYNLGLAMQRLGRYAKAEASLKKALALEPGSPDFLNALAILYIQQGKRKIARTYAARLYAKYPANRQFERLYKMTLQ